ncbi:hypothetical protein U1Q18_030307 [Sarracenia purpurea var. burkii]
MEATTVKAKKGSLKKKDSLQSTNKEKELADNSSLSKWLVKTVKPNDVLVLNAKQSQNHESCIQDSFLQHTSSLESRIPKHIVSLNEKYLNHFPEFIYVGAAKSVSCNVPASSGSLQMANLSHNSSSQKLTTFVIDCPLEDGTGSVVINSAVEWIVSAINRSKSFRNVSKSLLFRKSGAMESDINSGRSSLIGAAKSVRSGSDFISSGWLTASPSKKLEHKMVVLESDKYGSKHKRLVSVSSTNSTFSDQTTSSASTGITHGTLQCTWKAEFPHYVFSFDDQKDFYFADLFKPDSPDDKFFDYIYMFRSSAGSRHECEIHTSKSDLIGKMTVSTMFTLSLNNSEIMETEFVLFGEDASSVGEIQSSSRVLKKNKGLSKKMVNVFKTSTILENCFEKPCPDSSTNHSPLGATGFSDNHPPPNLELAAIIVKGHICGSHQGPEIGGWGLKFLKKVETTQNVESLKASPSECCLQNSHGCSTSVDILIPAGFHGGPRNRNCGPSSLIERWRSCGRCDCGGWDIGCPLTVLDTRPSRNEGLPQADMQRDCNSFDLFIQGSKQAAPTMTMVNINDGLYLIHFQSTLSALQCFSIAVAIIHTRSCVLQPKIYRS